MSTYDPGTVVILSVTLQVGGQLTDPTTLQLIVQSGTSKAQTVYTFGQGAVITRNGAGSYQASILANEGGLWSYKWISTGTAAGAAQGQFNVKPPLF